MKRKPVSKTSNTIGIVLVVAGLIAALSQKIGFGIGLGFLGIDQISWPLFIIVPGLILLMMSLSSKNGNTAITVVGTMATITGLLLAYQNTFHHYESWAYGWALVSPLGLGLGQILHGRSHDNPALIETGRRMVAIGAALFVAGAVFFELIINISGRGISHFFSSDYAFSTILIGAGVVFLLWRFLPDRQDETEE
jgi:peptidoglycan/LPS O-acetylase OafA/YrhL